VAAAFRRHVHHPSRTSFAYFARAWEYSGSAGHDRRRVGLSGVRFCLSSWPPAWLFSCFLPLAAESANPPREGVLADGLLRRLAGITQSDVRPAIAGQDDRSHVIEHPLPVFWTQFGIPFHCVLHLGVGEDFLVAERLSLEVSGGNAQFDQEALNAVDTPVRRVPDCIPSSRAGRHGPPESSGRPARFEDK
jgi:hypothetical protein